MARGCRYSSLRRRCASVSPTWGLAFVGLGSYQCFGVAVVSGEAGMIGASGDSLGLAWERRCLTRAQARNEH